MPVMFEAESLLDGHRMAGLVPATTADSARLAPGEDWRGLDDVALATEVYEVSHFGHFVSRRGEVTTVKSLATGRRYEMMVTGLRLVRCSDLTPVELADLGHATRQSFDLGFGQALGARRAWLVHLLPVAASAHSH